MKTIRFLVVAVILACTSFGTLSAHKMFDAGAWWESNEKTLAQFKWSQLFYELNVGWNISGEYTNKANFLYFGLGVGAPVTTKNAWRKFLPEQQIPDNEQDAEIFGSMDTKDVYGGKLGMGWIHFFNHAVGFYTQVSWGFLADFGSPDSTSTSTTNESKKTFIYNTVPVELGLALNMWGHFHLQGGVTYMWKEIPLLTIGIGGVF